MKTTGLAFCFALAAAFVFAAAGDLYAIVGPEEATVIKVDPKTGGPGETLKACRVIADDYDNFKIKQEEQGESTLKPEEIYQVLPTGSSAGLFPGAMALYDAGQWAEALDKFDQASKAASGKEWMPIYCDYYKGMCNVKMGGANADKGLDILRKFENNPNLKKHRFTPMVLYGEGEAAMITKKYPEAERVFGVLQKTKEFGQIWVARGHKGAGIVSFAQRKWDSAKNSFKNVEDIARAMRNPALELDAMAYQGKCLFEMAEMDKAKALFDSIIKKNDETRAASKEVMAAVYNGLGEYYYRKEGDKKKALLAHLRVIVVYSVAQDEYAKALSLAAKCFEELDQKDRAERLRKELKDRCPDSPYAK
jgi:tetratricopeptide (TPR) repeat protein